MEHTYQPYVTLTLSPYEAGVLKTIIDRIEIDDDNTGGSDTDYEAVNRAEDVLVDLAQSLQQYDAVDFPTRYYATPDA